jgi:hypothetical protein
MMRFRRCVGLVAFLSVLAVAAAAFGEVSAYEKELVILMFYVTKLLKN